MELYDKMIIAADILLAALLTAADRQSRRVMSSKWRLCWCAPMLLCGLLTAMAGADVYMLPAYGGAVVMLAGFFRDGKKLRLGVSAAGAALACAAVPLCMLSAGYRAPDYVKDFEKGFGAMKEHYILAEHKGIDWDSLYAKYLPMFREADRKHDAAENLLAWELFCSEFYDGHVGFAPKSYDTDKLEKDMISGNDYGLSLMTMSDGRTAAVNVEKDSVPWNAGIRNGTVITRWDGMSIYEAAEKSELGRIYIMPDKDNTAFYHDMFAAGVGGDSVEITFIGENGEETTVTAPRTGGYYDRALKTSDIVNGGLEAAHMSWTAVESETAVFRIKTMMYDSDSYISEDHSAMKEEIRRKAEEFKANGFRNLIIDIRSNNGGSGQMVMAIAELFAPEGMHYYCSDGLWDDSTMSYLKDPETGRYMIAGDNYYMGENIWDCGKIVLLVNAASVSAADHLTAVMQSLDNAVVMGFTEPNGSGQAVRSVMLESGMLMFSSCLVLDRDGNVFIDSGTDRESGNDIDIRIPFGEDAVRVLFDEGGDYVLQKALEYFGDAP